MVADITSVKIRYIDHRNLRIQDQYRGRRHHLSQDQIHWSQEPTYPRSILWPQTSPQSRSDSLIAGTYVCKINIVVVDITSVKIKFIGRKNLRIQDQYRGCRYFLSQDHIRWSQEPTYPRSISWSWTLPQSRSDSLDVGTYVSKINIVVADITSVKIRSIGCRNLRIQDQDPSHRHFLCQDQVLWSQTTPLSKSRLINLSITSIINNHFKVH